MNRLAVSDTPIQDLKVINRHRAEDKRGFLSRIFCASELAAGGWFGPVRQVNHTLTIGEGTLRGMHYQSPPYPEMKLVTCLKGRVWDVAVDIREGSPTFLHWHAEILSQDKGNSLLIPEGFAHGFQVLSPEAEMLYLHSADYNKDCEGGLNPLDERLAIAWPLAVTLLSDRDSSHPMLGGDFKGISL